MGSNAVNISHLRCHFYISTHHELPHGKPQENPAVSLAGKNKKHIGNTPSEFSVESPINSYLGQLQSPKTTAKLFRDFSTVSIAAFVECDTSLCREWSKSKHCYTPQYLEAWREPGPTQAGLTIADQPRTNRRFHRHFWKIELIWVVRLWTCCSDFSLLLAITIEHSV